MFALISPIQAPSAIQVASTFLSRPSFQCFFKCHANSFLAQAHNPTSYSDTFINFFVWDNKLNCLAEETLLFSFNKNATTAYIYNQALVVFLITTLENHRSDIGYPGIFTWISDIFDAAIKKALIFGVEHNGWLRT